MRFPLKNSSTILALLLVSASRLCFCSIGPSTIVLEGDAKLVREMTHCKQASTTGEQPSGPPCHPGSCDHCSSDLVAVARVATGSLLQGAAPAVDVTGPSSFPVTASPLPAVVPLRVSPPPAHPRPAFTLNCALLI